MNILKEALSMLKEEDCIDCKKEIKKVCPKCGKEVCECDKKLEEEKKDKKKNIKPYIVVGFDIYDHPDYVEFAGTREECERICDMLNDEQEREYGANNPDTYDYSVVPNDGDIIEIYEEGLEEPKKEEIKESVESSMPAQPLGRDVVVDFVRNVKKGAFFKVGYINEQSKKVASKYSGGRGSVNKETGEVAPIVKVFKCSEMYGCTGVERENKKSTIDMRANTGKERGENKGGYQMNDMPLKLGRYDNGREVLQFFPRNGSKPRVKWFISLNDEDLRETTKEEVAQYYTPREAQELLHPTERGEVGVDIGADIVRCDVTKIYMIGNLGHSIM